MIDEILSQLLAKITVQYGISTDTTFYSPLLTIYSPLLTIVRLRWHSRVAKAYPPLRRKIRKCKHRKREQRMQVERHEWQRRVVSELRAYGL